MKARILVAAWLAAPVAALALEQKLTLTLE
jgi:hypothetical protein